MSLPEPACQLMLYCRSVALMSEEEFLAHYLNQLSSTAKRQLQSYPVINSKSRSCTFPWNPSGSVESRQEPSPAISYSVPSTLPYETPTQLIERPDISENSSAYNQLY
jgi:hypothetical protein